MTDSQTNTGNLTDYGAIWTPATRRLGEIGDSERDPLASFDSALREGFFSQYTTYDDPAFLESLVDWQLGVLARDGFALAQQSAEICESRAMPDRLCLERMKRRVSADFLRNLAYVNYISADGLLTGSARAVLEIGSGYGAFARILKLHWPELRVCLVDLPNSLRCAEFYLRQSFPNARFVVLEPGTTIQLAQELPQNDPCEFILIPVDAADAIHDCEFDLVVNTWSFGEMPDSFLDRWFDLIQRRNKAAAIFTLNAFLHPVRPGLPHLVNLGNWLPRFDTGWAIERFNADLPIHRCPLIVNFPTGLLISARRLDDPSEIAVGQAQHRVRFQAALRADWVQALIGTSDTAERTEIGGLIGGLERFIDTTAYIGIFSLTRIGDGTFFALWNEHQLTHSALSAALLVAYFRLICRTDPRVSATREELFYVRQVSDPNLRNVYHQYFEPPPPLQILHAGRNLTIQEAYDYACSRYTLGGIAECEAILLKILALHPGRADCWFQLARTADGHGLSDRAMLYYKLADDLHPGWSSYRAARTALARRLTEAPPGMEPTTPQPAAMSHSAVFAVSSDLIQRCEWKTVMPLVELLAMSLPGAERAPAFELLAIAADGSGDYLRARAYAMQAAIAGSTPEQPAPDHESSMVETRLHSVLMEVGPA
jgi:hypothetical protein